MWLIFIAVGLVVLFFLFRKKTDNGYLINKLLKRSAKWATTAQQDDSPILSVLHSNYAVGYLFALRDIATPDEILKSTGIEIVQFEEHILNLQDSVTKKVVKKCPEFAGEIDFYLSTIAD